MVGMVAAVMLVIANADHNSKKTRSTRVARAYFRRLAHHRAPAPVIISNA